MRIEPLDLISLSHEEHLRFFIDFKILLEKQNPITLGIATEYYIFIQIYDKEISLINTLSTGNYPEGSIAHTRHQMDLVYKSICERIMHLSISKRENCYKQFITLLNQQIICLNSKKVDLTQNVNR